MITPSKCIGPLCLYCLAALLSLSGCSLIPRLPEPARTVLAGSGTKQALLQERVEKYSKARYWGAYNEALAYADSDARTGLMRQWKQKAAGGTEKLVDLNVSDVSFNEHGDAVVEVQIRYFLQPTYLVKTRTEKQVWRFYRWVEGGWVLQSSEEFEPSEDAAPPAGKGPVR